MIRLTHNAGRADRGRGGPASRPRRLLMAAGAALLGLAWSSVAAASPVPTGPAAPHPAAVHRTSADRPGPDARPSVLYGPAPG
jgi:hypothetical protein